MVLLADRAMQVRAAGQFGTEDPPSPCISVCQMDAASGWCEGCLRTLDEIAAWSRMDGPGKRAVWTSIEQRLALRQAQDGLLLQAEDSPLQAQHQPERE
jgi:predicted Fe-S protein YdhL (DUF1289 family)